MTTTTRSGGGSVAITRGGRLLTEGHEMDITVCRLIDAGYTDRQIVDHLVARGCPQERAWDRVDIARTV